MYFLTGLDGRTSVGDETRPRGRGWAVLRPRIRALTSAAAGPAAEQRRRLGSEDRQPAYFQAVQPGLVGG